MKPIFSSQSALDPLILQDQLGLNWSMLKTAMKDFLECSMQENCGNFIKILKSILEETSNEQDDELTRLLNEDKETIFAVFNLYKDTKTDDKDYLIPQLMIKLLLKTEERAKILQEHILHLGSYLGIDCFSRYNYFAYALREVILSPNQCDYEHLFDQNFICHRNFVKYILYTARFNRDRRAASIDVKDWLIPKVLEAGYKPSRLRRFHWQQAMYELLMKGYKYKPDSEEDHWLSWLVNAAETPQELGNFLFYGGEREEHFQFFVQNLIKDPSIDDKELVALFYFCDEPIMFRGLLRKCKAVPERFDRLLTTAMVELCRNLITREPRIYMNIGSGICDHFINRRSIYLSQKRNALKFLELLLSLHDKHYDSMYMQSFNSALNHFDELTQTEILSEFIIESMKVLADSQNIIQISEFFCSVLDEVDESILGRAVSMFTSYADKRLKEKFKTFISNSQLERELKKYISLDQLA